MKKFSYRIFYLFTFLLFLTACGGKYKYETVKGDQTKTRIYTLKNRLKVMRGGKVDTHCIPFYHVGNNDKQGLREGVGNPDQNCD